MRCLLMLLIFDQQVNAVECDSAVITDDSAAAVCIGQTCQDRGFSCKTHLGCVSIENALIMRFSVLRKDFDDFRIDLIAVFSASILRHSDAAERLQRTLERLVCLETDDFFKILVQVAGAV